MRETRKKSVRNMRCGAIYPQVITGEHGVGMWSRVRASPIVNHIYALVGTETHVSYDIRCAFVFILHVALHGICLHYIGTLASMANKAAAAKERKRAVERRADSHNNPCRRGSEMKIVDLVQSMLCRVRKTIPALATQLPRGVHVRT